MGMQINGKARRRTQGKKKGGGGVQENPETLDYHRYYSNRNGKNKELSLNGKKREKPPT
jgi:hypothetical protein